MESIEWDRIPKGAEVIDLGPSYVAVINGVKFSVCWEGGKAWQAFTHLNKLVNKTKKENAATEAKTSSTDGPIRMVLKG